MAKPKKNTDLSLSEFKAWLDGVEEMQPKDWAPNRAQWSTIRKKIDMIVESEISGTDAVQPAPQQMQHTPQPAPHQYQTSLSQNPSATIAPKPNSLQPAGNQPGSLKTPDIDTTSGNYESSFT